MSLEGMSREISVKGSQSHANTGPQHPLPVRKRKSSSYDEKPSMYQPLGQRPTGMIEFMDGGTKNGDQLSETSLEDTKRSLQVLRSTPRDVEIYLQAFKEVRIHYSNPTIIHHTFSLDILHVVMTPLKHSVGSQGRYAELQLVALIVLKQIVTQGIFIGEPGILCIEPFLQHIDSRLRNEVLRILAITVEETGQAQFILERFECVRGM
jgi:hypothetical protein